MPDFGEGNEHMFCEKAKRTTHTLQRDRGEGVMEHAAKRVDFQKENN